MQESERNSISPFRLALGQLAQRFAVEVRTLAKIPVPASALEASKLSHRLEFALEQLLERWICAAGDDISHGLDLLNELRLAAMVTQEQFENLWKCVNKTVDVYASRRD